LVLSGPSRLAASSATASWGSAKSTRPSLSIPISSTEKCTYASLIAPRFSALRYALLTEPWSHNQGHCLSACSRECCNPSSSCSVLEARVWACRVQAVWRLPALLRVGDPQKALGRRCQFQYPRPRRAHMRRSSPLALARCVTSRAEHLASSCFPTNWNRTAQALEK
jgi:hypothetical protein